MIATGLILVVLSVLWLNRWRLSKQAIQIADPLVRKWASQQVADASDSAYRLVASTIRVDELHRRISIDTITLTTDSVRNARLPRPHPQLDLRFSHCGLTGIDLSGVYAGAGLHALHAGCDSVTMIARTLVPPLPTDTLAPAPSDSNNFLRFQGKIELPALLPFVGADLVEFPNVHVELNLLAADGRRTRLVFDSIGVELDTVRIDPSEPVAKRRPLFSRDISVKLDRFDGRTKTDAHVTLEHLRANLEDGTLKLDAIGFEPQAGKRADSLGFASLHARHLLLTRVNWRLFLLSGDISMARFTLDTVAIKLADAVKRSSSSEQHPRSLESSLRGIGRSVRVDSIGLSAISLSRTDPAGGGTTVTSIRHVDLGHLVFGPDDPSWSSPFPVGRATLQVSGVSIRSAKMNTSISRIALDAAARRITIDSVAAAPEGDDSAFERRNQWRKSRLSVAVSHAEMRGIDVPAFLRSGDLRTHALDVKGLVIDVMKDKHKPEDPGPNVIRRDPQGFMRDVGAVIQIDSVLGTGLVTYRERDEKSPTAGTLTFGAIQLRGYNFSTDPKRMSVKTPFRLIGDARLMGAGAMHVEWNVPLLARDFAMIWHGTLGPMDPKAMNGFLPDAVGIRFTGGVFEGASWDAVVANGMATGTVRPRWHNLKVELPGVARGDSGVVGGILRGVAKLAANTFGIRSDNDSTGGHKPMDASISHQWVNIETLPQFIWFELRDPLLAILKK